MEIILFFKDIVEINGEKWFAATNFNALFHIGQKENEVEFVFSFPDEDISQINLYLNIIRVGDELVFVPNRAKKIAIYNFKSNTVKQLSVNNRNFKEHQMLSLYSGFKYGEDVYIFQRGSSSILRLNMNTKTIGLLDLIEKDESENEMFYYWSERVFVFNNIAILYNNKTSTLVFYNLDTKNKKTYAIDKIKEVQDFYVFENCVWFVDKDGNILKWDKSENINLILKETEERDVQYKLVLNDKFIYVLNQKNCSFDKRIDIRSNIVENIDRIPIFSEVKANNIFYHDFRSFIVQNGDLFVQNINGDFISINNHDKVQKAVRISSKELSSQMFDFNMYSYEANGRNIKDLLRFCMLGNNK